jgi:hypothetical protein
MQCLEIDKIGRWIDGDLLTIMNSCMMMSSYVIALGKRAVQKAFSLNQFLKIETCLVTVLLFHCQKKTFRSLFSQRAHTKTDFCDKVVSI